MDERDARILMALARSPFESLEGIGRALGISGTAVRARLDRLREAGIYGDLVCSPSARALGLEPRLALFTGAPLDAQLRALARADEVAWAARAYPTSTAVMLYRADPQAPLPTSLLAAAGRAPDAILVPEDPRGAAGRGPISPLDWRVIDAVMGEPRASLRDQARRARLSPRTVRERRDALVEAGDLALFPALDATREEGVILYTAYLSLAAPHAIHGMRIANAHRIATHHDPPGAFLVGWVRTYAEAHVVEEKLRAAEGVRNATFNVPQGTVVANERLRAWVAAQMARWDTARRRAV